jgi:flagellar hook-associated protein 3 FlgL
MRIATAFYSSQSVQILQQRQQQLSATQSQLTSGVRVGKSSDDPADAARAERAMALKSRNDATLRAVDASRNAMTLTESALGDASDMVQDARETLVALGNGVYSDQDRQSQVQKLSQIRDELLSVANRQDSSGGYLFGAAGSSTAPFSKNVTGTVVYGAQISAGQTLAASNAGEPLPLTVDGAQAWRMGNTPADDIFSVLQNAITALGAPGVSSAQVQTAVAAGLSGVDTAHGSLQSYRTEAGEALNRLDGVSDRLTNLNITAETERSNAVDLDLVEALSKYQTQQAGYDAALKAYASVQRMSLFQYISN